MGIIPILRRCDLINPTRSYIVAPNITSLPAQFPYNTTDKATYWGTMLPKNQIQVLKFIFWSPLHFFLINLLQSNNLSCPPCNYSHNRISSKAGQDPDSILAFKLPSKSSQSRPACKNLFDIRQLTVLQAFRDQAGNCENETVRCLTSWKEASLTIAQ